MPHYQSLQQQLQQRHPDLSLKEDQPLAQYTTFKIGGSCPLMAFPTTAKQVEDCLSLAKEANIRPIPLGNGSNLLVSDQGYDAFFINTKQFQEISLVQGQSNKIHVSAGTSLYKLATFAMEQGLSGLEFAQGIPGTLGGAIVMNAGAYGGEMCQVVTSVTSVHIETGHLHTRPVEDLDFSYRHSLFSTGKECILSAEIQLPSGNQEEIKEKMKECARQRQDKQPLSFPSCGSTFKRPPNHFAAALIDQCGLKGLTVGGAQVSPKHAGFVVNTDSATCADVLHLVEQVKETVLKETGIPLELEVQVLA